MGTLPDVAIGASAGKVATEIGGGSVNVGSLVGGTSTKN